MMQLDGAFANERFTQETDEPILCPNCFGEIDDILCECPCHEQREYDGSEYDS